VFPVELCEIPIKATCPKDGLLLDPFVGTGSSVAAALLWNRRGIGIDTSKSYLEEADRRLRKVLSEGQALTAQQSLFQA